MSSSRADRFRAGTSLYHLIISTAPKHGLGPQEPFVAVTIEMATEQLELTYWAKTGGPVVEKKLCEEGEAFSEIDRLLDRLRQETKGDLPPV